MKDNKKTIWQRILGRFFKEEQLMLVSGLDKEVEEIVNLMNQNGMRPYASCDGSIKTHKANGELDGIISGYIAMLDGNKARDLFAILQEDDSYKLSITSQEDNVLYGNELKGLRFTIYFDNLMGGKVDELTDFLKSYLDRKIKPTKEQRKRIDEIASLVGINKDNEVAVTYNIHPAYRLQDGEMVEENYSVEFEPYRMKKDLRKLRDCAMYKEETCLCVDLDRISYKTNDFGSGLKVLKGMYELYDMLPDVAPEQEKTIRMEEYANGGEHPIYIAIDDFNNRLSQNIDTRIKENDEIAVKKSIDRHQRKLEKMKKARQNKDSADIEI